ncbi:Nif3-like dinuclear metal center hexameric protein [Namhaeicola litoreus]|uniref:GTP cyclohydrolase 1 type 2 homolog n=1 Tax=Namhaeicola litoreus TaxID=1052145 RepID=A0ABW3Y2T6_9FLAO
MKVKEVIKIIEDFAPLHYAESFDNVGLIVGNAEAEVKGVLVSLDTLETTVDEAIEKNCNLIVSFHPIIFKGLTKIVGKSYVEKVVLKAIKHDIHIYAIHTALDNHSMGVSAKMAEKLGLNKTKILIPKSGQIKKLTTYVPVKYGEELRNALFEVGAGQIGNYDHCSFNWQGVGTFRGNDVSNPAIGEIGQDHMEEEMCIQVIFEHHLENKILQAMRENHPYEEVAYEVVTLDNVHQKIGMGIIGELDEEKTVPDFLNQLKETFHLKMVRHSDSLQKKIKKVAVLGGSGSFAIKNAISAGADIYVTADLKYHDFFQAEGKIVLADIGHYESEQFTKNLLVELLSKKITNFAIILSENNTNPINYY